MNDTISTAGLPGFVPEWMTLYLTAPRAETRKDLRKQVEQLGLPIQDPFHSVLSVVAQAHQLQELGRICTESLSREDLEAIKCHLAAFSEQPSFAQLMQTHTMRFLIDWINGQWLSDVLHKERLVTHFQPIVRSGHPDVVYAYECLLRGQEAGGEIITPDRLYSAARATGLLHSLDQAARLTAIDSASKSQLSTCVFINFNPRSIDDPVKCLESTLRATYSSALPPEQYVFEVVESDEVVNPEELMEILDHCRDAGCRVALDDMGAGYSSLNLMARIKPDFIKLDMGLIRNVDRDDYKGCVAGKLLELAKELGVCTVVEGVETVGEWEWATRNGADFAQGYLFARPAAIPPKSEFRAAPAVAERQTVITDDAMTAALATDEDSDRP